MPESLQTSMTELSVDALESTERVRMVTNAGYFPRSVTTADGAIVIVYRAGAGHMGLGGYLASVRSTDGGRTWSDPVTVVRSSDTDDRNPALGCAADGTLVCAYWKNGRYHPVGTAMTREEAAEHPESMAMGFVYSSDCGRSWGEPVMVPEGVAWQRSSPFGRILTLDDGTMVLPVYAGARTWLLRSIDSGRTWGDFTLVSEDMNETAYCVLPTGDWVLVGRHSEGHGACSLTRWSGDEGHTWSAPQQFLTHRRLPSDLAVLSDGSLLAVHGYRSEPRGVRAVRSTDGGRSWGSTDLVLLAGKPKTDLGYPSVEVVDGWVAISYYDASATPVKHVDPTGAYLEVVRIRESEIIERMSCGA